MGIKYFSPFIDSLKPKYAEWIPDAHNSTRHIIIWDALGNIWWFLCFLFFENTQQTNKQTKKKRERSGLQSRANARCLFDFKELALHVISLIDILNCHGFHVVAFVDYFFDKSKLLEKERRGTDKLRQVRKFCESLNQYSQALRNGDKKAKNIRNKLSFLPSSMYGWIASQCLEYADCTVLLYLFVFSVLIFFGA